MVVTALFAVVVVVVFSLISTKSNIFCFPSNCRNILVSDNTRFLGLKKTQTCINWIL